MALDESEHARWMATAEEKRVTAELLRAADRHADACVLYEQTCQLMLKAVLRGVGVREQHHDLDRLARRVSEESGQALEQELGDLLKVLARDYIPARYPDAYADGTPDSHYSAADAERAHRTAASTAAWVVETWSVLQDADADP